MYLWVKNLLVLLVLILVTSCNLFENGEGYTGGPLSGDTGLPNSIADTFARSLNETTCFDQSSGTNIETYSQAITRTQVNEFQYLYKLVGDKCSNNQVIQDIDSSQIYSPTVDSQGKLESFIYQGEVYRIIKMI